MIEWKFEIDSTEIDEPIGMDEVVFSIQRDDIWHGVFFEASTSPLGFYGNAYDILKTAKEQDGVDAVKIFTASSRCEGETDYTVAISGKLNFSAYQELCGDQCIIRMPVEQDNCAMMFKNRLDQKVNIDSNIAFDKQTLLQDYTGLDFNIELATQIIPISADADVLPAGDTVQLDQIALFASGDPNHQNLMVRPTYGNVTDNSILTGALDDPVNVFQPPGDDFLLTPQVLLAENPDCINQTFEYDIWLKGNVRLNVTDRNGTNFVSIWVAIDYWDGVGQHWGPGSGVGNATSLHLTMVSAGTNYGIGVFNRPFDQHFTGTVTLPVNYGLYAYVKIVHVDGGGDADITADYTFTFDEETSFLLSTVKDCPPTDCKAYMINETLARVTESITNRCLTIESSYYGRTDSQPYTEDADGCGGLRILTNGLKIRQANEKQFFASMQELMNGLRAIDNIGMGMETDRVRIESAEYFYQDVKILDLLLVPKAQSDIEERYIYSNILSGYNKWEIKSVKGIDEFCSYKERRTGISAVKNELDLTTDLIASGYIIENLRTSTLVNTGQTDNQYDNDVFIVCMTREGDYYVTFYATGNKMIFKTSGTGNEFLVGSITISGTTSNDGVRTVNATSISTDANGVTTVEIDFTGGATVDEVATHVTFPGITSSGFFVEQNITDNPANFFSPTTAYNWRIRPLYNMMRWFKCIAQSYANIVSTTSKIFFTSGKGNYLAEGNINAADPCVLEGHVMAENADIAVSDFLDSADAVPIYKPETITFTYPLSIADYQRIKATPYGYINVQCGTGDTFKTFIRSIQYKPAQGMAEFILIKKWQ